MVSRVHVPAGAGGTAESSGYVPLHPLHGLIAGPPVRPGPRATARFGLGRAPGTDPSAARALRRTLNVDPDNFPNDVLEVMEFLAEPRPGQAVQAVPGAGSRVPIWILGSSTFGAQVAAAFGLPFVFASHFAPALLSAAIGIYRERFRPSADLPAPYVMLGVNVVAADTDDEARFLASSGRQSFAILRSGRPIQLPPPSKE